MIAWAERAATLQLRIRNWSGGRLRSENWENRLEKFSPRDGRLLYVFGTTRETSIDATVSAARKAFLDGRWSRLPAQRRKRTLHQLADQIMANREELALLESLDVGKPISDALDIDVPMAAETIRACAEGADKIYGKVFDAEPSCLSYQLSRPVGVTAGIVGWNFPLVQAASKVGPALATGNSLILKPSELTPLSAIRLAELASEVGVPDDVLHVVNGDFRTGAVLAQHQDIDLLSFTGSTQTGKRLLIAAGQSNMKRLIMECGGKTPNMVFDDAPCLEDIVDAILSSAFWNQGQVCTASSRLLVQRGVKEELMSRLIEKAGAMQMGDPLEPGTRYGPVVSSGHRDKVERYVAEAVSAGARIAHQSRQTSPFAGGFYTPQTILDDVSPEHRIAKEEVFGPALSVISFGDEEEAIEIANGTVYGLSAVLWTQSASRVQRVTQAVRAGWIVANTTSKPRGGPGEGVLSLGGQKQSGIGVEGGLDGLSAYTVQTTVQMFS